MFIATKAAIAFYIKSCKNNPLLIDSRFQKNVIFNSLKELESTFTVRIFAEFEMFLRDYWQVSGKKSHPKAMHLINSVATKFQLC